MDIPEYKEFIPNLRKAEEALETVLDEEEQYHRTFNYHLEDAAFSGVWETAERQNEISVYQIANPDQVFIEGHSASRNGLASEKIGEVHISTINSMIDAQYGMLDALEPSDFERKPGM